MQSIAPPIVTLFTKSAAYFEEGFCQRAWFVAENGEHCGYPLLPLVVVSPVLCSAAAACPIAENVVVHVPDFNIDTVHLLLKFLSEGEVTMHPDDLDELCNLGTALGICPLSRTRDTAKPEYPVQPNSPEHEEAETSTTDEDAVSSSLVDSSTEPTSISDHLDVATTCYDLDVYKAETDVSDDEKIPENVGKTCNNLLQTGDIPMLARYLGALPSKQLKAKNETILLSRAVVAFHHGAYSEMFRIVKNHTFSPKLHGRLRQMWFEATCLDAKRKLGRPPTVAEQNEFRTSCPLPPSISFRDAPRIRKAVALLEDFFKFNRFPGRSKKMTLSEETGLSFQQVDEWFTNKQQMKSNQDGSWQKCMEEILNEMWRSKYGNPFRWPVNATKHPEYYRVVRKPVDLHSIKKTLKKGLYSTQEECAKDVQLIFSNSRLYNTNKRAKIYKMTSHLSAFFEKKMLEVNLNSCKAKSKASPKSKEKLDSQRKRDVKVVVQNGLPERMTRHKAKLASAPRTRRLSTKLKAIHGSP